MKRGWCRRDANHMCVIELALTVAKEPFGLSKETLTVMAGHVGGALAWEPVRAAVGLRYLQPEDACAWRALAQHAEDLDLRDRLAEYAAIAAGGELVSGRLEDVMTAEDLRVLDEAQQAENRGDFAAALALLGNAVRPLHDPWREDLEFVVARGDQLTPAQWGRLCCATALRWAQRTPLGLDRGIAYARAVLLTLGAGDELAETEAPRRAGYDVLVHDALLFDEGALSAYVSSELAPQVAARVPGIGEWGSAYPALSSWSGRTVQMRSPSTFSPRNSW